MWRVTWRRDENGKEYFREFPTRRQAGSFEYMLNHRGHFDYDVEEHEGVEPRPGTFEVAEDGSASKAS